MVTFALADDSVILRSAIKNALESSGYAVPVEADNSADLLTKLANTPVQVVLLDVLFPNENGLDILPELKKQFPATKVIIVTGLKQDEILAQAQARGADGVLYKPFDTDDLLNTIRRLENN
jgi:DNA-binding NarL/FixJ family response regulator